MDNVSNISTSAARLNGAAVPAQVGPGGRSIAPGAGDLGGVARETDRVELSEHAQLLHKLHELPEVRADLIEKIRAQIESSAYETTERIEGAIDALVSELDLLA